MPTENGLLHKYWRPVLIFLVLVLVIWIAAVSMAVLIPFLLGILLAYLLMPLVNLMDNVLPPRNKGRKVKRVISILIIFVVVAVLFVLFMVYMGSALISASTVLVSKAPEYVTSGMEEATQWLNVFRGSMPHAVETRIEETLANFGPAAGKFAQDFVVGSITMIPATMPTIIGFAMLPFFLFFVLYDYESFQRGFLSLLSANTARHTSNVLSIIGNVLGRYIRSQLILGLIIGVLVFAGLSILQVEYALAMGAVTALTQFIPIVGPVISGVVVVILTLAIQPDKTLWALIIFIIAQVLLNAVIVNWIQGKYMQIHPAIVMVLLVVGGYVAGFWGMILALPVCATAWEIYKYFRAEQQLAKVEA